MLIYSLLVVICLENCFYVDCMIEKLQSLCIKYGLLISDNVHCIKRHVRVKFD